MAEKPTKALSVSTVPLDVFLRDAPIMAHSIDQSGTIVNVSQRWADTLGYAPQDMIGKMSSDFLTPESRNHAVTTVLPKFWEEGYIKDVVYTFECADGEHITLVMCAMVIEHEGKIRSVAVLAKA